MSHWHLTLGELAVLGPAVSALAGGLIAFVAASRTSKANQKGQQATLRAAAEQAQLDRQADIDRERRDRIRSAYEELGGLLAQVAEETDLIREAVIITSTLPSDEWDSAESTAHWTAAFRRIRAAIAACRRPAAVWGSGEIRAAVGAISQLIRMGLGPPRRYSNANQSGHWIHTHYREHGGIHPNLEQVSTGGGLSRHVLPSIELVNEFVAYALAEIRHEQQPHHEPRPTPPPELTTT